MFGHRGKHNDNVHGIGSKHFAFLSCERWHPQGERALALRGTSASDGQLRQPARTELFVLWHVGLKHVAAADDAKPNWRQIIHKAEPGEPPAYPPNWSLLSASRM